MSKKRQPADPNKSIYPGVYKSGADTWQYKLRLPPDPISGKRPWEVRAGFETDYEAHLARNRRLDEIHHRINVRPEKASLAEYLDRWVNGLHNIRPSTRARYRQAITYYISPYIGHIKLRDLEPDHIRTWQTTLLTSGVKRCRMCRGTGTRKDAPCEACNATGRTGDSLARGTITHARVTLVAALNQAVQDGKLPRNVAHIATGVGRVKRKPAVWGEAEIQRFLIVVDQRPDAAFWRLAIFTQLRPGEIAGLVWANVDLTRGSLHVSNTRTVDDSLHFVLGGATKSPAGDRRIEIPASCIEPLRAHREAQFRERQQRSSNWNHLNLVFPSPAGRILGTTTIADRLTAICRQANIPRLTPHGLRHTGASWLSLLGEHPKVIAERLGHTSVAFTLDTYIHTDAEAQRAASARLDQAEQRLRDLG